MNEKEPRQYVVLCRHLLAIQWLLTAIMIELAILIGRQ